jgi:small conductance mechanosensitive channel
MNQIVVNIQEWLILYGIKAIAAVAILVLGWLAAKVIRRITRRILLNSNVDPTLISFITGLVYIGIIVIIVIASLGQLGIETASFIAVLGAAGLAIGLALQGSLSNFAAGVLMILFKPFKAGDYVEAAGTSGVVKEIKIFTTVLTSLDNKKVIVPNNKIMSDNIINHTANPLRRVDIVVGVSYGDDLDKVKKVLDAILADDDRILMDPAPSIGVSELADNSVNLVVRPWVNTPDYWSVYLALHEAIKKRFDAEGISIPFPQRDIHHYNQ